MKKIILLTILIGIIVIPNVNAFNVITHCYISSQMFDIWQYYDMQFYNDLTDPADAVSYLVKKYYYIGLTMPDMLDSTAQKYSIDLLNYLSDIDIVTQFYTAFDISDDEKSLLSAVGDSRIIGFAGGDSSAPNHNLEGCYAAAEYAKNNEWSSVDKALLYGQLMHVIQDQYAHMVMQPSLFGYGTAIESKYDNPLINNNLLSKFEFFYEIMVPANIPDFPFVKQMFRGTATDNSQCTYGWGDFNSKYWTIHRTKNWINMTSDDLPNLSKYRDAMVFCGKFSTQHLTFNRLKTLMHGWGILMFIQSGYNGGGHYQGGIYANPNQSLESYSNFICSMGDPYGFIVGSLASHITEHLIELGYLTLSVGATIGSGSNANADMLEYAFNLLKFFNTTPIRSVLEDTLTVDHIYNDIWPIELKTPHSDSMYDQLRDHIATFEKYGNPYKFNRLEAYNGEIDRIISMKGFYKYQLGLGSINGPKYLNYSMELPDVNKPVANIFTLSRKAGILGGIIPISNPWISYYDQPGIIDMHFELNGQFVYDSASVKIRREDAYEKINVDYKIINLGIITIGIGRKWNGGYDECLMTNPIVNTAKIEGQYNLNTNCMYDDNIKTVSYIVKSRTKAVPVSYSKMIDSDYRDYYNNPSLHLNQNDEYVQAFHNGNPFRKVNENPYDNVENLWPYILPIHYSNIINAPDNIVFNQSGSLNSGILTWHNNSSYGHRFKIWKEKYGSPKEYLGIHNDTSLTINSLQLYSMYNYHIQTINQDSGFYSDTSKKAIYVWPYKDINSSNIHPSSAWGTQILSDNGKLFMIYADGQDSIMFTYSTDNGINWNSSVKLDYRYYNQWVHNPSIYIENDTVYAVWIKDYNNPTVGDYLGRIRYAKFHYNSISVTPFTLKAVNPPSKGQYHYENYKNQPIIKIHNDSIYIFCQSTFDFNEYLHHYNEINSYKFAKEESNPGSINHDCMEIPKNDSMGNNKIEAFFVNNELLKFYYTDNGLYCIYDNGNVDILDEYSCLSNYLISKDPINQKINIISSNELSAKYMYYENGWHSENIHEYIERFDDGTMASHNDYISVVYKFHFNNGNYNYYVDKNPSGQWTSGILSQLFNLSLISSTERSEGSTLKPYYYNYITMVNPYDERIIIHKKYMGRGGGVQLDKTDDFSVNIKEGKIVKRKKENFGIKTEMGRLTVYYALNKTSPVNIDIHDISGRSIKRYREANRHSGSYELRILLPRGVYFIKARTSEWNYKKKFIIL